MSVKFTWHREGRESINDQVRRGLKDAGDAIVPMARAVLAPHRQTGASADTIRVGVARGDPPAVFVASRSGDSFFIHEGTVDTAPIPFLTIPLDTIAKRLPNHIKNAGRGGLADLNRQFAGEFGVRRTE